MNLNVFLQGKSVFLRPIEIEDAKPQWLNDQQVSLGNSHGRFPYTREQAENYIRDVSGSCTDIVLGVCENSTSVHFGNISLQKINFINRSGEFAILIGDKSYWGRGFAYEAAHLLCSHAFKTLNLERVYCGTFENNEGMIKLAKKLGMKEEGRRRKAAYVRGKYLDVVEFGLLKNEFAP